MSLLYVTKVEFCLTEIISLKNKAMRGEKRSIRSVFPKSKACLAAKTPAVALYFKKSHVLKFP